jgi:hypothetical protein
MAPRKGVDDNLATVKTILHFYRLDPRDGKTFVRTEESFEGLVARLFRGSFQKTLDSALADGLRYLKIEAEQRATAP